MITLIVSRGYSLSRLVVRTRLIFLKTCGGLKPLGNICFEERGCVTFSSAAQKLDNAVRQLRARVIDLILGINERPQA